MEQGSGTISSKSYPVDPTQLAAFVRSGTGSQYKDQYDPANLYEQQGQKVLTYKTGDTNSPPSDVTGFMAAFQSWLGENQQTQSNWEAYAAAVDANKGGEGDNTITTGAAVSQRNQLLGSLANAGNTTTPTPGTSMGIPRKLGSQAR